MTSGAERLPAQPVETPEQQRERFLSDTVRAMAQQGMLDWQKFPAEKRDEGVRQTYSRMIGKLKTLHASGEQLVKEADIALAPLMDTFDTRDFEMRLQEIYDRIEADVPEYGEEPKGKSYLTHWRIDPMKKKAGETIHPEDQLSLYSINNGGVLGKGDIRTDIDFLKGVLKPLPANTPQSNALVSLILHLEQMRLTDPPNAVAEEMTRQIGGRTLMDTAGKEMGRVALTGFLLAGTVIFGTIALVQFLRKGEVSFAPFLWGIATLLMADKDLLKSFFGKDASIMKDFEQINRAATSNVLIDIAKKYAIGGPKWAEVVQKIYDGDHGKILEESDPDDESIVEAINDISGEPAFKLGDDLPAGSIRATLWTMFHTEERGVSDFSYFVRELKGVESSQAQTFIGTYVRNDAFRKGVVADTRTEKELRAAAAARAATK